MTKGCPPSPPSAWKLWLACAVTLFGCLGFQLLLPPPVQETERPFVCPQPCCAYKLPATSASRSVSPIAASVNQ